MFSRWWNHRHFVTAAVQGEIRGRYVRSRIGLLWTILHPLAQALIFALVLSEVIGARIPDIENKYAFSIYLMSGMAAWSLFSEIVNRCLNLFTEYGSSLKKMAFPKLCLPLIVWGTALINHALLLIAIMVVFSLLGHLPGTAILAIPLGAFLISIFAFGLGILLGILNVFARDVGQVFAVVLQVWFWMTPIVYPASVIPEGLRPIVSLNPMVGLVSIYQNALLSNIFPALQPIIIPFGFGIILCLLSFFLFRRVSDQIVDEL